MSITTALVAARKAMQPLIADETARIASSKGQYSFKYVSLTQLIDTIMPPLLEAGVYMGQSTTSEVRNPNEVVVSVITWLYDQQGDSSLNSGLLSLPSDGSAKDMAGKITSLRRLQLMAFLGLAASDEEEAPVQTAARAATKPAVPTSWIPNESAKKAAEKGRIMDTKRFSDGLHSLITNLRLADTDSADEIMSSSQVNWLRDQVGDDVLAFLYGRVITTQTPPGAQTAFLGKGIKSGEYDALIKEVETLLK